MWLLEVWLTWDISHTFGWLVFLAVVALTAGIAWGWAMWYIMASRTARRDDGNITKQ